MKLGIQIVTYLFIAISFFYSLWLSNLNYKNRNAKIPEEVNDIYDQDEYKRWHQYYIKNFKFGLVAKTINTLVLLGLLVFGYFPFVGNVVANITVDLQLQVVFFLGFYYLVTYIIGIFISYYNTFVIEEEFGFNKTTKKTFFLDRIKQLILVSLVVGLIIYGISKIYYTAGNMFFVYSFLACFLGIIIGMILYVPVIVPLFNKLTPLEDGSLKTKIEEFAKSVGYQVNRISVINASKRSTKLNAYFSGFGKFKRIVLYDTLIEKCTEEEIVAVLAHEIGHNKYKHMWTGLMQTVIMLAIYLGLLILLLSYSEFSTAFGFAETNAGFSVILFMILVSPLLIPVNFIAAYISRCHEYQADNYAATNYEPIHIETALKKLAKENFSNLTPHPVFVKMYYSHPPTANRVRAIRKTKE